MVINGLLALQTDFVDILPHPLQVDRPNQPGFHWLYDIENWVKNNNSVGDVPEEKLDYFSGDRTPNQN